MTTQDLPSLKNYGAWVPQAIPRPLLQLLFACAHQPVLATMFPAIHWPHQPTNTSTLQPNNPLTPIPFNTGPAECAERLNNKHWERNKTNQARSRPSKPNTNQTKPEPTNSTQDANHSTEAHRIVQDSMQQIGHEHTPRAAQCRGIECKKCNHECNPAFVASLLMLCCGSVGIGRGAVLKLCKSVGLSRLIGGLTSIECNYNFHWNLT